MRKTILVAAIMAIAGVLCSCNGTASHKGGYGKFMDAEVYDSLRNRAYDLAMDLVTHAKAYHAYYCNGEDSCMCEYMCISPENRHVIETYRVPDFWVLVHSVDEMDRGGDLSSYDWLIQEYDEALNNYMEYSHQL